MITYSPKDVSVVFGGNILQGFADGTFVGVEPAVPRFTTYVPSDGVNVARARSLNPLFKVMLTLSQASLSNAVLSALHNADVSTGQGTLQFTIRNKATGVLIISGEAWIVAQPKQEFAKEISTREWTFELTASEVNVG